MRLGSKAAYLAGLFDSSKNACWFYEPLNPQALRLTLSVPCRRTAKWLVLHFGGNLLADHATEEVKYGWELRGHKAAVRVLSLAAPFLKVRKDAAAEVLTELAEPVATRQEQAAYQAAIMDTHEKTFVELFNLFRSYEPEINPEKFLLSILPYMIFKKNEANALLQTIGALKP